MTQPEMNEDIMALFEEAYELLEEGELEDALEQARRLLAIDDENAMAWCLEGQIRLALGEVQPAERAFDRACRLSPGNPEPLFHKTNFLLVLEEYEEACRQAEQSLQFAQAADDRFQAYLLLAEAQQGHARMLTDEWEAELHGADSPAELALAHMHDDEEHAPPPPEIIALLEKGLASVQKALDIDDEAPEALDLKAQYQLMLGDLEGAIASWEHAAQVAPYEPVYWHFLGNAYAEVEEFDKAYEAFQELYSLEANDDEGMEFGRDEFLEIARQACADLEAEVHDQLEAPIVFTVSAEDFPSEDLIESAPREYPFDPWIPCVIKPGPPSEAHESVEFVLFQRNVEREAVTEEPEELYQFIAELLGTLLLQASAYMDEEEPIEA
jgi:tetratricopeptide (TPR) repeat protein